MAFGAIQTEAAEQVKEPGEGSLNESWAPSFMEFAQDTHTSLDTQNTPTHTSLNKHTSHGHFHTHTSIRTNHTHTNLHTHFCIHTHTPPHISLYTYTHWQNGYEPFMTYALPRTEAPPPWRHYPRLYLCAPLPVPSSCLFHVLLPLLVTLLIWLPLTGVSNCLPYLI